VNPRVAAILAGNVGPEAASAFINIRKIRHKLPTVDSIINHPDTAIAPTDASTSIAALGLIAQACLKDPCAGLVYADRLNADVRIAALQMIGSKFRYKEYKNSPWFAEGEKALKNMIRSLGNAIRNV